MQTAIALPAVPTGKIKSFGEFGEPYEVGQLLRQLCPRPLLLSLPFQEGIRVRLSIH